MGSCAYVRMCDWFSKIYGKFCVAIFIFYIIRCHVNPNFFVHRAQKTFCIKINFESCKKRLKLGFTIIICTALWHTSLLKNCRPIFPKVASIRVQKLPHLTFSIIINNNSTHLLRSGTVFNLKLMRIVSFLIASK